MSEVRLIDANALEKLFEEECAGECPICGYSNEGFPCGLIKTAPTVTPDMAQVLAYECGKASADRPIGEWVPVSERLPKAGEYVGNVAKYYLVQNEYGDMLVARYARSGYWEQIYQHASIADEIVAWMPLPQPYKKGSVEQ